MKLTFIDCPCGSTKGRKHSENVANCISCSKPNHVDIPVYHTYELDSLSDIEQRAREQAVIDMWLDDMLYIDWSTCFDAKNIINLDEWEHYYENKNETVYINKDNEILSLDK